MAIQVQVRRYNYQRSTYSGVVVALSQHTYRLGTRPTICLGEVYNHAGGWVADHSWILGEELGAVVVAYGDVLTFSALLAPYLRGGRYGARRQVGYKFIQLQDVRVTDHLEG